MEYNASLIPIFIEANSKQELMQLMWENNTENGKMFNYMNPIKDGKKWVVWFYADVDNYKKPKGGK